MGEGGGSEGVEREGFGGGVVGWGTLRQGFGVVSGLGIRERILIPSGAGGDAWLWFIVYMLRNVQQRYEVDWLDGKTEDVCSCESNTGCSQGHEMHAVRMRRWFSLDLLALFSVCMYWFSSRRAVSASIIGARPSKTKAGSSIAVTEGVNRF